MVEVHPITWIILIVGAVAVAFMALFMGRAGNTSTGATDPTSRTSGASLQAGTGAMSPVGAGNDTAPNAYLSPLQQSQAQSLTQQVANNGSSSVFFSQLATMYGFSFQDIYAVHNSPDNSSVIITFKNGSQGTYANPAYIAPTPLNGFNPASGGSKSTEPATRPLSDLTFVDSLGWVDKYGVAYTYSNDSGQYVLDPQNNSYYNSLPQDPPQATLSGFLNFVQQAAPSPTNQQVITMADSNGVMQPMLVQNYSDGSSKVLGTAASLGVAPTSPTEPGQGSFISGSTLHPPDAAAANAAYQFAQYQQTGLYHYIYSRVRNFDYGENDPRGWDVSWRGYYPDGTPVPDFTPSDPSNGLDPARVKSDGKGGYWIYGWRIFNIKPPAVW